MSTFSFYVPELTKHSKKSMSHPCPKELKR